MTCIWIILSALTQARAWHRISLVQNDSMTDTNSAQAKQQIRSAGEGGTA